MKLKFNFICTFLLLSTFAFAQNDNKVVTINAGADIYPFLASASNNTTYKLEKGKYYIDEKYEKGLVLKNAKSVTIRGEEGTSIYVKNGYMNVITIENSENIKLENLYMTHDVERGDCDAPVVKLVNCNNVVIYNSVMDGSGTLAAEITDSHFIDILESEASHNTEGVFRIESSTYIDIKRNNFYDNTNINWGNSTEEYFGMGILNLSNSDQIRFIQNNVYNNSNKYFLKAQDTYNVTFNFNTFKSNSFYVDDASLSKQMKTSSKEKFDYCYELEENGGVQIVRFKIESNGSASGEIIYSGSHGSDKERFVGTYKDKKLKVEAITELEIHEYEFFFDYSILQKDKMIYTKVNCN